MPISENPLSDAMTRIAENATSVLDIRKRKEDRETQRREEILNVMQEINDNPSLCTLLARKDARPLFETFGRRGNGNTEVYGIPLIGSTQMPEMLALTDEGVEWLEANGGIKLADARDFQTVNLCKHRDWLTEMGEDQSESKLFANFFNSSIGLMNPEDFEGKITDSLKAFADKVAGSDRST